LMARSKMKSAVKSELKGLAQDGVVVISGDVVWCGTPADDLSERTSAWCGAGYSSV
jgi:hypothetical protein